MNNPWETVSLSDYEQHMSSDDVMQLQTLNDMMRTQLISFPADTAMILGIAGGNGLEHISTDKYRKVYGVDVNEGYLDEVKKRYAALDGCLECICADLTDDKVSLPHAGLLIADLLIEYIGYDCFERVISVTEPEYISCGVQIDTGSGFVSESPLTHSFDCLGSIHRSISPSVLTGRLECIGYDLISSQEYLLPNGKKLIRTDHRRTGGTI